MNIITVNLNFGHLDYNNDPDTIILHHAEASKCSILDINTWHKERGWAGVGYDYFVRKDGSIYKGRPDNAEGSHCRGYNAHSIGICAEGEYMNETMPDAQKNAIIELCVYLIHKYPKIKKIFGHGEVYATDCPGKNYPLSYIKGKALSGTTTTVETKKLVTNRTWLQVGDTGAAVTEVQTLLNKLGFNSGTPDGAYGKNTKNAVFKFQQALELQADGLAGSETIKALREIASKPLLKIGASNIYAIKYLQYRVGAGVDGGFGTNTDTKVKAWQKANGLTVDGQVGPKSWTKLIG